MDKIGDQIEIEILDPLLCSASVEQLARTFERFFPTFRDYCFSSVLILWGSLREDTLRFSALTVRGFQESEHLIRGSGPRWIGLDASLNALSGIRHCHSRCEEGNKACRSGWIDHASRQRIERGAVGEFHNRLL